MPNIILSYSTNCTIEKEYPREEEIVINGVKYIQPDVPSEHHSLSSYFKLDNETKKLARDWILDNFIPRKNTYIGLSSYGLKHCIQADIGVYLTSGQFEYAMIDAGFIPSDRGLPFLFFNVSKRSRALNLGSKKHGGMTKWRQLS